MDKIILTLNAGSSSIKFSIYQDKNNALEAIMLGNVSGINTENPKLSWCDHINHQMQLEKNINYQSALHSIYTNILKHYALPDIICHRVVHGGKTFSAPVLISDGVIEKLESLIPLAPLHQPYNLLEINWAKMTYPSAQQIACFDTAFHSSISDIHRIYAIPKKYTDAGIIKYGFHGLSYAYITRKLIQILGKEKASKKTLIAHLGSGASLCIIEQTKSRGTSMGFSALDGLPMASRCGLIDPGVLLYFLEQKGYSAQKLQNMLYKKSGLFAIADNQFTNLFDLFNSSIPSAQKAIAIFVNSIVQQLLSLTAITQGIERIVFTAGVGENSAMIREKICQQLNWLGVILNSELNQTNQMVISHDESKIEVMVIPTNEEYEMAISSKMITFDQP